jgi:hypothetical protein
MLMLYVHVSMSRKEIGKSKKKKIIQKKYNDGGIPEI